MTPPAEYFVRCDASEPGAQRIGFEYYRFIDGDSLDLALTDGYFEEQEDFLDALNEKEGRILELEARIDELEAELEEKK